MHDPTEVSDKMRALVQLAASVADQLAKVATSLAAEADMLAKPDTHHDAIATLIRRNADRTHAIVHSLLTFAGRLPVNPCSLSIATVVSDLQPVLQRLVGPSITLTVECTTAVAPIYADPVQIETILCTLAGRARDAMPDGGGLTMRATDVPPFPDSGGPSHVRLQILDTGETISSPDRIFEPVLVRKGHGLWLGLSSVYGAICQMNGRITVVSEAPSGTTFTFQIPSYDSG
jgi:two-component system cell cycle sensor histidine kinase/response regulator CckA